MIKIIITFWIFSVLIVTGCSKKQDINLEQTLCNVYKKYDIKIGTAISPVNFNPEDEHYLPKDVYKHFNSLTPGNEMKMYSIYKGIDEYNFTAVDEIVEFAQKHNMSIRGHTLYWYKAHGRMTWLLDLMNERVDKGEEPIDVAKDIFGNYVRTVVQRYKGKIYVYDMFNETVNMGADIVRTNDEVYKLIQRKEPNEEKAKNLFVEFVAYLIKEVRKTDPDAKLLYNDIKLESSNGRRRGQVRSLFEKVRAHGADIDGIGFQSHINIYTDISTFQTAIDFFKEDGYEMFEFTELDVSVWPSNEELEILTEPTQDQKEAQATTYKDLFELAINNKEVVTNITVWGFYDEVSWIRYRTEYGVLDFPLLFDENKKIKKYLEVLLSL